MTVLSTALDRHLPLAGTYNVRDVGGYATRDGRRTRWRTLLRADSLHRLTEDAQTQLIDAGVRTVVDLRHAAELTEAPNVFLASHRLRYVHAPLFADPTTRPVAEQPELGSLAGIYRFAVEQRGRELTRVVSILAGAGALPALVHCTAGKDRTGLAIALALAAVNVPDDTIAEDYALSAQYLVGGYFDEARARAERRGIPWEAYQARLVCPAPLLLDTLALVRERSGGVPEYLLEHGLTREELESLRAQLLEA
jgi:protein-tyrosine phosphatase